MIKMMLKTILSMPSEVPTAIPAMEAVGSEEAASEDWLDDVGVVVDKEPPSVVGSGGSRSGKVEKVVSGAGRLIPVDPKSSLRQRISNAGADRVVPPNTVVANLGFSSLQSKPLDLVSRNDANRIRKCQRRRSLTLVCILLPSPQARSASEAQSECTQLGIRRSTVQASRSRRWPRNLRLQGCGSLQNLSPISAADIPVLA
jgi:hypothetical protein